jgi:Lipocalin-like domain
MNHKKMNTVGQQAGSTLKDQLAGTWKLVSAYSERQDGSKRDPLGANPAGIVMFDANGRVSVQVTGSGLPTFASNNRLQGTTEENKAIVQGTLCYFGKYSVSEVDHTLNLHIESSSFPNWNETDQKRFLTLTGDEMKWTNPIASSGGTGYSVWKRAK